MSEVMTSLGRMTALKTEVKRLKILLEASNDSGYRAGQAFRDEYHKNKELEKQNEQLKRALNSIIDGNWSCIRDRNNLEVWSTDRINPSRIARQALGGEQQ